MHKTKELKTAKEFRTLRCLSLLLAFHFKTETESRVDRREMDQKEGN